MAASSDTSVAVEVKSEEKNENSDQNVLVMCKNLDFKNEFTLKLSQFYESQTSTIKRPWTKQKTLEIIDEVKQGKDAMERGVRRQSMQYYWCSKYDVVTTENKDYLIYKKKTPESPAICVIPMDDYFDIISEVHTECDHGGRDKILKVLKSKFLIPKKAVEIFVSLCPVCRQHKTKKGEVVSKNINVYSYLRIVDLQCIPDGEYKWLLSYQDLSSNFLRLRPLRQNEAKEIALELLKIFLEFGAPCFIQSHVQMDFLDNIVQEILNLWPECKTVSKDVEKPPNRVNNLYEIIETWIRENKSTNWSLGCYFIQYNLDVTCNKNTGVLPIQALSRQSKSSVKEITDLPQSPPVSRHEYELEISFDDPEPEKKKIKQESLSDESDVGIKKETVIDNLNSELILPNDVIAVEVPLKPT